MKQILNMYQRKGMSSSLSIVLIAAFYCLITFSWYALFVQLLIAVFFVFCFKTINSKKYGKNKDKYFVLLHSVVLLFCLISLFILS